MTILEKLITLLISKSNEAKNNNAKLHNYLKYNDM